MDKEGLKRYLSRKYVSKNDVASSLPLGADVDSVWEEILQERYTKRTVLPLTNVIGDNYWYVLTDKMISASEIIVDQLINSDCDHHKSSVSTIEEVYFTGFIEGAQISIQDAMDYLQSGEEPRNAEELILMNSRQAAGFAAENIYHSVDANFLHNLAYFLTDGLENGSGEYRSSDSVDIPSMQGKEVTLPLAADIPDLVDEFTRFLVDVKTHPLIKAAVAQAWILAVRPFPEGNERLSRLISSVILIRSGYKFFADISISSTIARTTERYFNAIADILRVENDSDMTYFLEYYLEVLSDTVKELRSRREESDLNTIKEEQQQATVPLKSSENTDSSESATEYTESSLISISN